MNKEYESYLVLLACSFQIAIIVTSLAIIITEHYLIGSGLLMCIVSSVISHIAIEIIMLLKIKSLRDINKSSTSLLTTVLCHLLKTVITGTMLVIFMLNAGNMFPGESAVTVSLVFAIAFLLINLLMTELVYIRTAPISNDPSRGLNLKEYFLYLYEELIVDDEENSLYKDSKSKAHTNTD